MKFPSNQDCVFPSLVETAYVVSIFKKDSKLSYSNYNPISLLSVIEKILEKLMYKKCIPSSVTTILSKTYGLNSGNKILRLMP